jgi:hypothetical protein
MRLSEAAKALTTHDHVRGISGPSTFLNTIYSYALAMEEGYFSWTGVSHGLICLARNNTNSTPKLYNLTYMQSDNQRFLEDYLTEDYSELALPLLRTNFRHGQFRGL